MPEQHKIDEKVRDIADEQIEIAQLPVRESLDTSLNLASKTTAEQDRKSAGQRDINFTWEDTQKRIALFVVYATNGVSAFVVVLSLVLKVVGFSIDITLAIAAFTFMSSTTSLVVGFYFSRTNHARIGDDPKRNENSRGGLDDR